LLFPTPEESAGSRLGVRYNDLRAFGDSFVLDVESDDAWIGAISLLLRTLDGFAVLTSVHFDFLHQNHFP
jgi:hypothetical protein